MPSFTNNTTTTTITTRLPGPDKYKQQHSQQRREVVYKRINFDCGQKTAWTVFPIKLPSMQIIKDGLIKSPSPSYKYWKGSQNISKRYNKTKPLSEQVDNTCGDMESPLNKVNAILRRLNTFDLLQPNSTSIDLLGTGSPNHRHSDRKPKDVKLSVQTLYIPSEPSKKQQVQSNSIVNSMDNKCAVNSESKVPKRISFKERQLHQINPCIALPLSERSGGMKTKTQHIKEHDAQTERSMPTKRYSDLIIERIIPKGVIRTDSGHHFSMTHFNKISVFDNDNI